MAIHEKPYPQEQVQEEVSEQTRTFAAWWLYRFERTVQSHGLTWHRTHPVENGMGEIQCEWWYIHTPGTRKKLTLFIEDGLVTYLRTWDWDDRGRCAHMEEGECTWLDTALLVWYWLTT